MGSILRLGYLACGLDLAPCVTILAALWVVEGAIHAVAVLQLDHIPAVWGVLHSLDGIFVEEPRGGTGVCKTSTTTTAVERQEKKRRKANDDNSSKKQ